jgi:hypothetical protein
LIGVTPDVARHGGGGEKTAKPFRSVAAPLFSPEPPAKAKAVTNRKKTVKENLRNFIIVLLLELL